MNELPNSLLTERFVQIGFHYKSPPAVPDYSRRQPECHLTSPSTTYKPLAQALFDDFGITDAEHRMVPYKARNHSFRKWIPENPALSL